MEKVQYAIEIVNRWDKPLNSFQKKVDSVSNKRVDPFQGTDSKISQTNNLLGTTESKLGGIGKTFNLSNAGASGLLGIFSKMIPVLGAISAFDFFKKLSIDGIMAHSQVEKYNVTLKTMLGSTSAARDRMQEYFNIAAKTPFQLNQVVEAGNQLQAIGRYSAENLTNLGDLAAASGKPIEQALTAYAKLATGQKGEAVNMFRDLLISTEDWVKATGKGIKANGELEATTEEMIAALPGILKGKGYLGMMEAQAKTTEGKMSNLQDSIFQLHNVIGERLKPTTDRYLDSAMKMVSVTKEWVEVPTPLKIAQEKAELNALVGIITDANTGEQTRNDLLQQLQQQYPEFLANLDLETVKNEELIAKLKEVNKQYEAKMKVAGMQTRVSAAEEKYQNLLQDVISAEVVQYSREEANKLLPIMKGYASKKYMFSPSGGGDINDPQTWVPLVNASLKKYYGGNLNLPAEVVSNMEDFVASVNNMQTESSIFREDLKYLQGKLDAQYKIVTKEKERLNQAERDALLLEARGKDLTNESTYEQLFGSSKLKQSGTLKAEFEGIRQKTSDVLTELEWSRLYDFMQGNLAARATGTGGTGGGGSTIKDIQKAEDLITGGGKNVKVLNIYLDSLIASNTNVFDQGEDPASAEEFMTKLTNALQVVVNDTNYVE